LEKRGLPVTDDVVDRIFASAKASVVLREDEILRLLAPRLPSLILTSPDCRYRFDRARRSPVPATTSPTA
jgi:hypothetical protein